ncbi:hypothetical protein ABT150_50425 [Streptomyces mirabilis]|uniref:hypothetical protein n=1 Tax=Streptomyces mirabilis TaxID=68239 RepID=UPI00332F194E
MNVGASAIQSPTASSEAASAGEREHDGQAVAHPAWIARIGDLGQPPQQARDLLGCDLRMLAKLVRAGGIADDASAGTVVHSDHGAQRTP